MEVCSVYLIFLSIVISSAVLHGERFRFNDRPRGIVFPHMNDNGIPGLTRVRKTHLYDELDLPTLNSLNTISHIDQYAKLFGFELPLPPPPKSTPVIGGDVWFGTRSGVPGNAGDIEPEELEQAICKPDLTPVKLDLPIIQDVVYFPSCVRLPRCGGCCYGSKLSCQPLKTKTVRVQVLKVKTSNSVSSSRRRTRHRRSSNEHITVKDIEHISCKCQCKVQERHCNLQVHKYSPDECACKCKNSGAHHDCRRRPNTHLWDSTSCKCLCKDTHECSSSEYFSHQNCSCVYKEPKPGRPAF